MAAPESWLPIYIGVDDRRRCANYWPGRLEIDACPSDPPGDCLSEQKTAARASTFLGLPQHSDPGLPRPSRGHASNYLDAAMRSRCVSQCLATWKLAAYLYRCR